MPPPPPPTAEEKAAAKAAELQAIEDARLAEVARIKAIEDAIPKPTPQTWLTPNKGKIARAREKGQTTWPSIPPTSGPGKVETDALKVAWEPHLHVFACRSLFPATPGNMECGR